MISVVVMVSTRILNHLVARLFFVFFVDNSELEGSIMVNNLGFNKVFACKLLDVRLSLLGVVWRQVKVGERVFNWVVWVMIVEGSLNVLI